MTDALTGVGITLVSAGLWLTYPPAAIVFVGLVCIRLAVVIEKRRVRGNSH